MDPVDAMLIDGQRSSAVHPGIRLAALDLLKVVGPRPTALWFVTRQQLVLTWGDVHVAFTHQDLVVQVEMVTKVPVPIGEGLTIRKQEVTIVTPGRWTPVVAAVQAVR